MRAEVYAALASVLRCDPATLRDTQTWQDLGLDSVQYFEVLYELEQRCEMDIPDNEVAGVQTVGALVAYLDARREGTCSTDN